MTALLRERHCTHGAPALDGAAVQALRERVPDWYAMQTASAGASGGNHLYRRFEFRDFHETMEFVNALAFMIHREDHHPALDIGYKHCAITWTTHSAGNRVTENDFICAARADALYAERAGA